MNIDYKMANDNLVNLVAKYRDLLSFLSGWILVHPVGQILVRWMRQ